MKKFLAIILAFASVSYAVEAFYRHHQRTVTTSLEADLVNREIGIDGSARNSLIAKKANGDLIHVLAKEMDTASLNGVLNVAGQTNLSGAVKMANYTSGRVPYFTTGGLITDASTLTYNGTTLAVNNGTYSGTLLSSGLFTADDGIQLGTGTGAAGRIYTTATSGTVIYSAAGSSYDFMLANSAGSTVLTIPTGTTGAQLAGTLGVTGAVTHSSTLTQTGAATFASTMGASGVVTLTSASANQLIATGGTTVNTRMRLMRGTDDANQYLQMGWDRIEAVRANAPLASSQTSISFNQVGSDGTRTPLLIGSDGTITVASLAGTGTRLTTSTSTGVQGNATTIAGANTWSDAQTFTAAPVLNALTASLPVFTNGSKAATSNAMTGTGSVVMSTSPTLVTPALGAATATSVAASGAVSALNFTTTGGEAFTAGDTSFTLTGSTGWTTTPTGTAYGTRFGNMVVLFIPYITGTSNSASTILSGLPVGWRPTRIQWVPMTAYVDGGGQSFSTCFAQILTDGTMEIGEGGSLGGWTTINQKALGYVGSGGQGQTITYTLQ